MKLHVDKKRADVPFEVGDAILVKLQPHRQITVQHIANQKLSLKYFGQFPIITRIGSVAYRVNSFLLPKSTMSFKFHN